MKTPLRYPTLASERKRALGTIAAHCALLPAICIIGYAVGRLLALLTP
jgi:hypothetical protein